MKGAQAAIAAVTLYTLMLTALFAERRRNEATLKESERRFRLTADAAPVMVWISGIDKLCIWFNKPWLDFVGRTMAQELGKGWCENVHADDFDRCLKTYVDAFDARQPFSMEYRLRRHCGEYRWLLDNGIPLWEPAGVFAGYIGSCVDITERKRAEADLAERQAQLAVFVEHAPAAIAMFDREMRYLAVSRRFVSDFRLPPDAQLIGKSHYQVFPEIPQHWRDIHARVLAGEELSNEEEQFTRQDGRTEWTGWSMVPWRRADRSIGGALLFVEIRTEQVEAGRALADSEARFRATFENAAVGVAIVGSDGSILRANNSFARMLGYSVEELRTRTFQDFTHPDDLATNLSVLNKALVGEADSYCIEKRYVRKDGGIVWASLTVGCVRKTVGGVDYLVSVVQDITDRKRVEEHQRTLVAELDHRVKNALATVSAVVSHTQQGSRSVVDFVAALDGRIRSMATTHELLSSHQWQGVSLTELVQRELAPYATHDNTEINGPGILLKPEASQAMAMVLHELATNAAKYGALSTKNGRVSIRWHRHLNGYRRSHLVLEWQEIGGPPVAALCKSSYGTSTIRDLIPYELGGTVDFVPAPEGVRCRLELPADWLGNDGQPLGMHHGETEKPEFESGHRSEQTDR
jgi:PAS domain S-box-containing protein